MAKPLTVEKRSKAPAAREANKLLKTLIAFKRGDFSIRMDIETGQLVIRLASQVSEAVSAVVRVPPPPANSAFHWDAGDHIVGIASTTVSVPVDFRPLGPGTVTQTMQLISNAQGSLHLVTMHATAKKGIVH